MVRPPGVGADVRAGGARVRGAPGVGLGRSDGGRELAPVRRLAPLRPRDRRQRAEPEHRGRETILPLLPRWAAARVLVLVERFDIEPFPDFSAK